MSFQRIYTYKSKATLWRIIPDSFAKYFWLEERDATRRSLAFTCLHPSRSEVKIQSKNPDIPWEGTLATVGESAVAFHLSRVQQSPVFQGVAMYSPDLNTCLYRHPTATLVQLLAGEATVLLNGEPVKIALEQHKVEPQKETLLSPLHPEFYAEGSEHFAEVARFLEGSYKVKSALGIHYLEWKDLIVVATYQPAPSDKWSLIFMVLDANGSIVEKFTLAKALNGLGNDTFFAFGQYLVLLIDHDSVSFYV
jgi:hypothetical protein